MECWYCHWGWSKPVSEIYQKALEKLEGNYYPLLFGPAHIVWEDENFDRAQWCLDNFDDFKGNNSDQDLEIVKWSLEELLKLPLDQVCVQPANYDFENPEDYPPPSGITMVPKLSRQSGIINVK